jgi:hypothetical protein
VGVIMLAVLAGCGGIADAGRGGGPIRPLVVILRGQTLSEHPSAVAATSLIADAVRGLPRGTEVALFSLNGSTKPLFETELRTREQRERLREEVKRLNEASDEVGTCPGSGVKAVAAWLTTKDPRRPLRVVVVSDLRDDPVVGSDGKKRPVVPAIAADWSFLADRKATLTAVCVAPDLVPAVHAAWRAAVPDTTVLPWTRSLTARDLRLTSRAGGF